MNDLQIDNVATDKAIAVIKVMEFPNKVTR